MWDPELLARGKTKVTFRTDMPARFGILARHANGDAIKWFEAETCYMYHTINAWESGDEVVLVGCRIDNPLAAPVDGEVVPHIDVLRLQPYLYEWRFNLVTGAVRERALDDVMTEFPRMNNAAPRAADAVLVQPAHRGAAGAAVRRVREVRHRAPASAPRTATATAASAARPCSRRAPARRPKTTGTSSRS